MSFGDVTTCTFGIDGTRSPVRPTYTDVYGIMYRLTVGRHDVQVFMYNSGHHIAAVVD